jgi:hypothetical chaperone protein
MTGTNNDPHKDRGFAVGIDFGTTNSSIAISRGGAQTELFAFPTAGGTTFSYRSVLYMDQLKEAGKTRIHSWTGPAAIAQYLADDDKGRLIQ